ncbi:S41 family peptidase [Massilia sp. IC2-476]|uniref:S41 family peptidase n=1 Tax=Massilia sp. IC2-476 TaxID=2887199 RepID=UPI001D0F7C98|nr:S41 family peptidase [Massilia sp. IC2-476]MCC2974211.1 S41 family peptidase [Massilia sp. IC2-476]
MRRCVIFFSALLLTGPALAEPQAAAARAATVQAIANELNTSYIDAAKARQLAGVLQRTDFAKAKTDEAFADMVTQLMQDQAKDLHLRLFYNAEALPEQRSSQPSPADVAQRQQRLRKANYGIDRVERLPGNIGYLKTSFFAAAGDSAPFIGAAMTLLSNADALIIDLRENDGGSTDGVPLLASYLFDERVHIADLYRREGNLTEQQWTSLAVPGSRFGAEKDVYLLTSKSTFSAAEGLAFALQNKKRVTIVGETTRGGAHPARIKKINAHFRLMVPTSTARDPVTLKDWEGVGVAPDIAVPAAEALARAQLLILKKAQAGTQDAKAGAELQKRIDELVSQQP